MQPTHPLLVLKFGGAALAHRDGLTRAGELIAQRIAAGHRVCVVVSAAGDTTDYFARQAEHCGIGVSDREADALMACGENITAALMAMHLRQRGHEARSLSGAQAGFVTDAQHGDAAVLALEPHRVRRLLNDAGVYDRDPTEHASATLQVELNHDQLLEIVQRGGHAVVQAKAIVAAREQNVMLRIAPFVGAGAGTVVRGKPARTEVAAVPGQSTAVFEQVESAVRSYCRSFPTVFARAKGAHLFDEAGRSYIDFFAGAGALNYGHNPDFIRNRLIEHLQRDAVTHALDMFTTTKRDFLEEFRSVVLEPRGLDYKVQFCGPTGANSVEARSSWRAWRRSACRWRRSPEAGTA